MADDLKKLEDRIRGLRQRQEAIPGLIEEARAAYAAALGDGRDGKKERGEIFDLTEEAEALETAVKKLLDDLIAKETTAAYDKVDTETAEALQKMDKLASLWQPVTKALDHFKKEALPLVEDFQGSRRSPEAIVSGLLLPDLLEQVRVEVLSGLDSKRKLLVSRANKNHRARLASLGVM